MRKSWERGLLLSALLAVLCLPSASVASTISRGPGDRPALATDLRETIDRAIGYKRPQGATYANGRGEIVSPRAAGNTAVPRVHFTLLGSSLIAASINNRLHGLFGQRDTPKTSKLTPTNQR